MAFPSPPLPRKNSKHEIPLWHNQEHLSFLWRGIGVGVKGVTGSDATVAQ